MNFGASESEDCEIVNAFNKILEGLTQHVHDPFFQVKKPIVSLKERTLEICHICKLQIHKLLW